MESVGQKSVLVTGNFQPFNNTQTSQYTHNIILWDCTGTERVDFFNNKSPNEYHQLFATAKRY